MWSRAHDREIRPVGASEDWSFDVMATKAALKAVMRTKKAVSPVLRCSAGAVNAGGERV